MTVSRAVTTLGPGDAGEAQAERALAALDALVDEGEPIVSIFQARQDGPWALDVLFQASEPEARARWLSIAREIADLPPFTFDALADRDWVAESQRQLHPVRAGRFIIHGSHDAAQLLPSRWRIEIDAGRAFGTAHHATTAGCLVALERLAKRGPLGRTVDVGTGSGVLALAAERLGATHVVASDIDPDAVEVARWNVAANGRQGRMRLTVADGPTNAGDTVVANILARPLIALAPRIAALTGRHLVLSGLRTAHVRAVRAAYRARGLVLTDTLIIDDWATLTLAKPHRPTDRAAGLRKSVRQHPARIGVQPRRARVPDDFR